MKFKPRVVLILVGITTFACFSLYILSNNRSTKSKNDHLGTSDTQNHHKVNISEKEHLLEGISRVDESDIQFEQYVFGGIIPHHLLASELIADLFKQLSSQSPQTIILIGPNHFERGNSKVLTSLYGWDTPYGLLEPDQEFINKLVKQNLAKVDETVLNEEHSITAITPFIRYYLPQAKIVPIVLSSTVTKEDVDILAKLLVENVADSTVVIASVDFSHYLKSEAANINDQRILKIINNFDYGSLFGLGNDYLDSPPSIALLLTTMRQLGHTNQKLLRHTNSAEILNDTFVETTSYITMIFY